MKLILSLIFAVAALAQPGVSVTTDGSVTTRFGTYAEHIEFRTGSPTKSPAINLVNKGQGLYAAALPSGGILSVYRDGKEWLRLSAEGIQLVTDDGIVPTLTGAPKPGCAVDYIQGLAVEKCPDVANLAADADIVSIANAVLKVDPTIRWINRYGGKVIFSGDNCKSLSYLGGIWDWNNCESWKAKRAKPPARAEYVRVRNRIGEPLRIVEKDTKIGGCAYERASALKGCGF